MQDKQQNARDGVLEDKELWPWPRRLGLRLTF